MNETLEGILFDIKKKMWNKASMNESERYMGPLIWYINTGRAPTDFIKLMVNLTERQKSTIANKLIKYANGDYQKCIDSICKYIGFNREG